MAITTFYRGIEYRSRLEAKWASFFDLLGWQHTYEPFDGNGYIPDFLIHGDHPLLVEVKPAVGLRDYMAPTAKAENGLRSHWESDILIVGADPLPQLRNSWGNQTFPPAGLLGEFGCFEPDAPGSWQWDTANWLTCRVCDHPQVFHESLCWTGRPCGHGDGDHHLCGIDRSCIQRIWAAACNDVKWRGYAA